MLTPQAQSVALLTAALGPAGTGGPKALTIGEWAEFAQLLQSRDTAPAQLLGADVEGLMADWPHRTVTAERVRSLLDRGIALGICQEKWERAGIWLLTRSDAEYPRQLKRRLEWQSPPVLFGCGNRDLLAKGGLAVVGSRDASGEDLATARALGGEAAGSGLSVVSGGARGVDEAAMLAGLDAEGTAVGVLAADLLRAAAARKWRRALLRGDLVLVSPYAPEARFHPGHAMARNRYIYCLASRAVVVASSNGSGGTWAGAVKNLKHGWVPLWVCEAAGNESGNGELANRGARPLRRDGLAALFEGGAGEERFRYVEPSDEDDAQLAMPLGEDA